MTTEQKQTKALFDEAWKRQGVPMKCNDFSFEIRSYETPLNMWWHKYESPCKYTFPSVRAAQHWLNMYRPDILFYDVILVYQRANCPAPFALE